jgi:chromosome segregation ATPase
MSGFVDLRLNRRRQIEEGFWPSFTDIMTVVVMIFLMGLLVVLLQNIEVTNDMKAALLEKQKATELALSTSKEKDVVSSRLSEAEEELARLRMLNILANDQRKKLESQLATATTELDQLNAIYSALQVDHESVREEKARAEQQLDEKSRVLARIETRLNELTEQYGVLESELADSRQAQEQTEKKLALVSEQAANADLELASIRGEYSDLQVKYNKLIKPARTSRDKHVVEVVYARKGNKSIYRIKNTGDAALQQVSLKELHSRLAKLKAQHGKKLYVRLILPEDSDLSYNDAWKFTKDILGKYDYYHAN